MTSPPDSRITGPFFKWFGGKWNASKHYPTPTGEVIIEPFAGSACYSLRYFDKKVIIAEKDPHLNALWKWLIHEATESDVMSIPVGLEVGYDIRNLGLSPGQSLLVKSWQRTNNVGNCWTVSSWGNKPGQWTESSRLRVANQLHLIKHWEVKDCGLELMEGTSSNGDLEGVTWFVDPPYQNNYQYRNPLPISYQQLGKLISSLNGQIICCEAICPKTGTIPNYLPFEFFRSCVTSRRKSHNSHHSKELIWYREG